MIDGLDVRVTCEGAPVQIEGTIDGVELYFRSRWSKWGISIGKKDEDSWDFFLGEDYGKDNDASWMPVAQALAIVEKACELWRVSKFQHPDFPEDGKGAA